MSVIISFAVTIGFFYLLYKAVKGSFGRDGGISPTGRMICPACGTRGEPKTVTRGSLAIEIVLWICLLLPGLIYSLWRMSSRQKGCPSCGATGMIGVETPMGKTILGRLRQDTST